MAPADESRRLAKVAAVTDDLDRILDRLFANVAELREILGQAAQDQGKTKEAGE